MLPHGRCVKKSTMSRAYESRVRIKDDQNNDNVNIRDVKIEPELTIIDDKRLTMVLSDCMKSSNLEEETIVESTLRDETDLGFLDNKHNSNDTNDEVANINIKIAEKQEPELTIIDCPEPVTNNIELKGEDSNFDFLKNDRKEHEKKDEIATIVIEVAVKHEPELIIIDYPEPDTNNIPLKDEQRSAETLKAGSFVIEAKKKFPVVMLRDCMKSNTSDVLTSRLSVRSSSVVQEPVGVESTISKNIDPIHDIRKGVPNGENVTTKPKKKYPVLILRDCMKDNLGHIANSVRSSVQQSDKVDATVSMLLKKQQEFLKKDRNYPISRYKFDLRFDSYKCEICLKDFDSKLLIRQHMKQHANMDNLVTCDICSLPYSKVHLQKHMRTVHTKDKVTKTFECDPCSLTFDSRETYNNHVRHHRPFKCSICMQMFKVKLTLKNHIKAIHNKPTFKCLLCPNKLFTTKYRLKCHHIVNHTTEKPFKCKQCPNAYALKYKLFKHQFKHVAYESLPFKCQQCSKAFRYRYFLKNHMLQNHTNIREFECDICERTFVNKEFIAMHMKIHTKLFQCNLCKKSFSNLPTLKVHLKTQHSQAPTIQCNLCEKKFFSRKALMEHSRNLHTTKKFECTQCSKIFKNGPGLNRHNLTQHAKTFTCDKCSIRFLTKFNFNKHRKEKCHKIKCKFCDRTYSTKYRMKMHERIHSNEKPFECSECKRNFRQEKTLTYHMKIVHENVPKMFKCNVCPMSFMKAIYLKNHQWHHKGKTFKCDLCSMTLINSTSLKYHKARKHNDEQKFKCELCYKTYKLKIDLKSHLREVHMNKCTCDTCGKIFPKVSMLSHLQTHLTNRKKFKCDLCNTVYVDKQTLTIHYRNHTNVKPYKCVKCNAAFIRSDYLKKHEKKVHMP